MLNDLGSLYVHRRDRSMRPIAFWRLEKSKDLSTEQNKEFYAVGH